MAKGAASLEAAATTISQASDVLGPRQPSIWATSVGLTIALAFPLFGLLRRIQPHHRDLPPQTLGITTAVGDIVVVVALVAIIVLWERLPLSSVGIHRFERRDFVLGFGAFGLIFLLGFVAKIGLYYFSGSHFSSLMRAIAPPKQLARFEQIPSFLLLLIAITAGMAEELGGRGYAIERIESLSGSTPLAALVAWIVPSAMHALYWGPLYPLMIAPTEAVFVGIYVWRRRLAPCVIAHASTDAMLPLVIMALTLLPLPHSHYLQASLSARQGKIQEAINQSSAAIASDPRETKAYYLRAQLYVELGELEQALADIKSAIAIKPDVAYFKLKEVIDARRKDRISAIDDMNKLLAIDPSDPDALETRSRLYVLNGEYLRAFNDANEAFRLGKPTFDAILARGEAEMALRRWQESSEDLHQAVTMNPNDAEALNALGWTLSTSPVDGLRDGKRAVDLEKRACDLTSWQNGRYILALASAYAETGDFDKAVAMTTAAIKIYSAYAPNDRESISAAKKFRNQFGAHQPYRM